MIVSFKDKRTAALFQGLVPKGVASSLAKRTHDKLAMIEVAKEIDDLRVPPGNRLEKLKGNRAEQYSIRVNDQWRICFEWRNGEAHHVEFVDYH